MNKFVNDNTLLNQEWIIDPKKKVKEILKEVCPGIFGSIKNQGICMIGSK